LSNKILHTIKPEIRILGIDDGKFRPHSKDKVPVIGVVFRGGSFLEGIMNTNITVDGLDATRKINCMITSSPHFRQLRIIMLNGITFGGFNVADIKTINEKTGLPVIVVTDRKPDLNQINLALRNLPQNEKRWRAVLNAGEIFPVCTRGKQNVFVEVAGISRKNATEILRLSSTRSKIPEPLRVAHLVASGISPNLEKRAIE
jgi:uncharacterized protein